MLLKEAFLKKKNSPLEKRPLGGVLFYAENRTACAIVKNNIQ
jgi:hypothetical protein